MSNARISKSTIFTLLGLLLMFGFRFLPAPQGLDALDMQIAGVFLGTVFLWLFVSVSWPSMLVIVVLIMSPLYTAAGGLAASMGSWVTSFVLFSAMVTYALNKTGFLRRCAVWFITRPIAKKDPWLFVALFLLGPLVMGSFMSPLPTFIVFAAVAEQVFLQLGYNKGDRFPQMMILSTLAISSLSTATTPIAHSVPVLGFSLFQKDTGTPIGFVPYTIFGVAVSIVIYLGILLIMRYVFRPDMSKIKTFDPDLLKKEVKPMTMEERYSLIVFGTVVALWMLPGIVTSLFPSNQFARYFNALGASVPPLLGAVALCLITVKGKPIMQMEEAIRSVPWVAVMMVAGTMILGSALTHKDIGLTMYMTSLLKPIIGGMSPMGFVAIIACFTVLMTSFASDTVTVTVTYSMVLPLVYSGAIAGVNPAALTSVIGGGACLAAALPSASGHAAVAGGGGWLKNEVMFKYGILIGAYEALVLAFVGYPIASLFM